MRVDSPIPILELASPSHEIVVNKIGSKDWTVELAAGRVLDNRHFELEWEPEFLQGPDNAIGASSSWNPDLKIGHAAIWLEAPAVPPANVMKREMVFLLDCSGSMSGQPLEASKAFMRKALSNLRPTDTFRVIRFSDAATEFSTQPIAATRENLKRGIAYVNSLEGSGGTMMSSGVRQALDVPGDAETLRLVTFLTDGYIGNDFEILKLIEANLGHSRLYAIGVGAGTNTYLLDEIGTIGRGFTRYIDPTEDIEHVAAELAERLQSPVLTDIEVDWGDDVKQVYPTKVPDLFAGQSIRLVGMYDKPGVATVRVSGVQGGVRVSWPVHVFLSDEDNGVAIQQTWARSRVKALMQDLLTNPTRRTFNMNDDALKTAITHMGLEYRLMTQWTSFVAVAETTNIDPRNTKDASFSSAPVEGVAMGFVSGAPEPGTMGGLLLMGLGAWAARRRRRVGENNDQEKYSYSATVKMIN